MPSGNGPATHVGVVGAGLIGGSIVRALRAADVAVTVYERDAPTRRALTDAGIPLVDDLGELARGSTVVFVAVPPQATAAVVSTLLQSAPAVVVSDTASVKESVWRAVSGSLAARHRARFVPGHPLAGRESRGWEHADPAILAGAVWALSPAPDVTDAAAVVQVLELVTGPLGARAVAVDPHEHDVTLAHTSHMPHLAASALMATVAGASPALRYRLSGGALRDGTRVAAASTELWGEILRDNAGNITVALDTLIEQLGRLRDTVAENDWQRLLELWRHGAEAREELGRVRWTHGERCTVQPWEGDLTALLALGSRGALITAVARTGSASANLTVTAAPAAAP